jgi:hypothetical protein
VYCRHPAATPHDLEAAFRAVPQASRAACAPPLVARIESGEAPMLRPFIVSVGADAWSPETLLRGAEQALTGRSPEEWELAEVEDLLEQARGRSEDQARLNAIVALVASCRKKLADRAKKQAAQLLAARPDFDEIEKLFAVRLPTALRAAWGRHYEGNTLGHGFVEAKKGKLDKLTTLATKLLKDLARAEQLDGKVARDVPEAMPFRLLPFAVGEHEDEYFALDLSQPTGDGDFAVVVVYEKRREGWHNNPTSVAWLAEPGVTHH